MDVIIIFKAAIPFCITQLLMFLYTRSDSILIKKLLPDGDFQAGIYAAGFRLLDAANMVAFLVTPLLIPMYARLEKNKTETRELIQLAGGLMIAMAGGITIAGFWWGREIMALCYGHTDAQWVNTFTWLILGHLPIGMMYIYGSYLTAVGLLGRQNRLFVFSVLLNFGLNFWLIPRMGTEGAAMVSCITQSLTTIGLIWLVHRHLALPVNYSWMLRSFTFFLMLTMSGWLLRMMPASWVLQASIFVLLVLVAAFGLRLLDYKKLRAILRERM